MADDFEVDGADQMLALSKALKHAGRTELRRELNKGLRQAAKPLMKQAKANARNTLPRRGGFAAQVAREPMRTQVRTGRNPGVRIVVGKKRGGARMANRGYIRHPVFGNRDIWVTQRVPSDWFDKPMRAGAPVVRPELERAMQRVAEQVIADAKTESTPGGLDLTSSGLVRR